MHEPCRGGSRTAQIGSVGHVLDENEKPHGQQNYLRSEHDDGWCGGARSLLGEDRWSDEPPEGEAAEEAADVGGVADVGDGETYVEVQGGQDEELPDQGVLPGESAAAHRVAEHATEQAED